MAEDIILDFSKKSDMAIMILRYAAGVLPRDHDDQEPKKGFVGLYQDSSSAKDQGKNNMATERLTEKSMRKPGEDQSLVVKQEYLSNNVVERDTKPKTPVDNPTGYDPFLVGGGINQDDLSSKEKKKGGRRTPYSEPSKNVVDSVARTSSPLIEKEKKGMTAPAMRTPGNATMLSNEQSKDNAWKIQNSDPPKTTATHVGVQSKNESVSSSRTSTQPHGYQNTTFESIPQTPSFEKEKKDDGWGTQYSNSSSKANATDRVEAGHYVANKDIGVPLVPTNKARRNNTSTTTRPYQKPKKGGCSCSVL